MNVIIMEALFLRNNIVGVVLVVSLIVWIPGACLFHWLCDVLKLWKKCLPHKSESDDGKGGSAFVAQYSWIEVKPDLMVVSFLVFVLIILTIF
jgi:hypothetical protein